jgi:hypothetical protein
MARPFDGLEVSVNAGIAVARRTAVVGARMRMVGTSIAKLPEEFDKLKF